MEINELKFYHGNTKRVGVNYFDSEYTIKPGIETTGKVISIFEDKGFFVKEISLTGGVSELSHTGYLSYGAEYTDVKTFMNNAYSDYVTNKTKAKEEYKEWLSSYNFEYFFVLFEKNECSVRFFVRAGKDITIKYDDCIRIAPEMEQIASCIKQDVYQNNCLVKGLEKIEDLLDELNVAKELDQKQLFLISVVKYTIPLLMDNNLVLLYTEKEKAETSADRFRKLYKDDEIKVSFIKDNKSFFVEMIACGFNKFILDGAGKIHNFSDFCDVNLAKNITDPTKRYDEIDDAQPNRHIVPVEPAMTSADIAEALKRLPKIHRNRLIAAYVYGLLSVTSGTISGLFQHSDFFWIEISPLILIVSIIKGFDSATKVSDKLKEKNPVIAKVAKFSLLLHLVAIIIFILLMLIM